jgi:hypothetical protein
MAQHEELDVLGGGHVRAISRTKPEHLPEDHVQQPH